MSLFKSQLTILQEAFTEVVQYFGENPKQSQPNTVFSVLQRFVDGFRVSEEDFQLMQLLTGPLYWMTSVWRPKLVLFQLNQIWYLLTDQSVTNSSYSGMIEFICFSIESGWGESCSDDTAKGCKSACWNECWPRFGLILLWNQYHFVMESSTGILQCIHHCLYTADHLSPIVCVSVHVCTTFWRD